MAPVSLETGDVSNDTTQQQQHDGTPQADGNTNFDVHTKEVTDFEQKEKEAETQSIPQRYEVQQTLGEGTFAIVYKAMDTKNDNRVVAIKRIKLSESEEARNGIDHGALREIRYMQEVTHVNVLKLLDVYGHGKEISLVFDFMVTDLQKIINDRSYLFSPGDVKSYMLQTMTGLECLHANWILHRDLKPDNLLISATGVLKIADFGLARDFGTPNMNYTSHVVTLWYRAPELLLGAKSYGTAVDVWSCGCIMAELLQRAPFLPGEDDWRQLLKIFQVLGSPSSDEWPGIKLLPAYKPPHPSPRVPFNVIFGGATKEALSLLEGMFTYYPVKRFTATQCLQHPYFSSPPAPTPPAYLPGADTEAALREEGKAHQLQQHAHDHTQQLAQGDKRQGSPADDEPPAKRLKE